MAESMTSTVNYADRASAVLWGDGAAALLISPRLPGRARISHVGLQSSPASADRIVVPRTGHFRQEGRAVQMFGIRKSVEELRRLQDVAEPELPLHFVGHQANLRMLEQICHKAEVPEHLHAYNVDRFGNTGAASGASVLSMRWDRWRTGDQVAAVGVGAGLTWGGYLMEFTEAAA